MRIDARSKIAGYPATAVRSLLRHARGFLVGVEFVSRRMSISGSSARALVEGLEREGYLEKETIRSGYEGWTVTNKGSTLAQATAAKPVCREKAEARLKEFLDRVRWVNRDPAFAYKVEEVVLFGSMLSSADRVNDVDVAVRLVPREKDHAEWRAHLDARTREALESGRRFPNTMEQAVWPQVEVMRFLKARSRVLSVHTTDDGVLKTAEKKVIFRAEA